MSDVVKLDPQMVDRKAGVNIPSSISRIENFIYINLDDFGVCIDRLKRQFDANAVLIIENCVNDYDIDCSILYKSLETPQEVKKRVAAERKRLAGLEKGKKNRRALYERLKQEFGDE